MAPILPLPPQTIDRIAAGEVIQRPSAIIKELIENSLDASSTTIDVSCKGLDVTVSDNGCGIDKDSLRLACTRFATSKIVNFDDLRQIKTFGFRGEALASCSMVGRVTVTSRTSNQKCAYRMSYQDGMPAVNELKEEIDAKPCAGKEGTMIQVQDLFYNVPSRRKAIEGKRNEREEYDRILSVVQRYAIHEARRGVGFLCRGSGKGGKQCDLNTQSLGLVKRVMEKRKRDEGSRENGFGELEMDAVKEVIGHVFGSDVIRELLPLSAGEGDVNAAGQEALKEMFRIDGDNSLDESNGGNEGQDQAKLTRDNEKNNRILLDEMMMGMSPKASAKSGELPIPSHTADNLPKFSFAYKATGLITNGSYSAPKSSAAFLLFINDRLVDSPSLRRAIETIYADTLPKGSKPFVYLALEIPGPHVDVNVHPTKREVTLLHEDLLCDALMTAIREVIGSATSSRTFVVAGSALLRPEEKKNNQVQSLLTKTKADDDESKSQLKNAEDILEHGNITNLSDKQAKRKLKCDDNNFVSTKRPYDPSRLVRTNRAALAGALEPFLTKKDSIAKLSAEEDSGSAKANQSIIHKPECRLSKQSTPDMTVPGAFATAICRCQVRGESDLPSVSNEMIVRTNPTNVIRPKRVTPTECDYNSIIQLRNEIFSKNHQSLNETLRGSTYIGAVSRSRSLIQSGIDLLMINHRELAREMFYQLALLKFGGAPMAKLGGGGVNVMSVIGDYLQSLESEDLQDTSKLTISKTNVTLARQATSRLAEKAPMLEDYFSVKFERRQVDGQSQRESLWLTGLPILVEGLSPQPYALPSFLLRLATEVDWTVELPCFRGVCKELAYYYAEMPITKSEESSPSKDSNKTNIDLIEDETKSYVKHTIYPVIAHLLVPPKEFADNGSVVKLANLTSLYKVFERC